MSGSGRSRVELTCAFILAGIQVGIPMIGIQPNYPVGVFCWMVVAALLIDLCWRSSIGRRWWTWIKVTLTAAILVAVFALLWSLRPLTPSRETAENVPAVPTAAERLLSRAPRKRVAPIVRPAATSAELPSRTPTPAPALMPTVTAEPNISFDYQGQRIISSNGSVRRVQVEEYDKYWKMYELAKRSEWDSWIQLRDLSELEMRRVPAWVTPQVYAGIAYSHLGPAEHALTLLEGAAKRIEGNPEYAGIVPLVQYELARMKSNFYSTDVPPPGPRR